MKHLYISLAILISDYAHIFVSIYYTSFFSPVKRSVDVLPSALSALEEPQGGRWTAPGRCGVFALRTISLRQFETHGLDNGRSKSE